MTALGSIKLKINFNFQNLERMTIRWRIDLCTQRDDLFEEDPSRIVHKTEYSNLTRPILI